jgi:formylmethanofuran dehydrogenase subunit A
MAHLNQEALALTLLPNLKRELTLSEVASMTRSAAATLLGLNDRGHLAPGAVADVAVYDPKQRAGQTHPDYRAMFADAALLFKNGRLVVQDGVVIERPAGLAQTVTPVYDAGIIRTVKQHFDRFYSLKIGQYAVNDADFGERPRFKVHE